MDTATRPPTRRRPLRWGVLAALALVCAPLLLAAAVWHSQAALAWALARVPGVQVQGLRGSLGRGHLEIDSLQWTLPAQAGQLRLQGLALGGLVAHWWGAPVAFEVASLRIAELHVASGAAGATPSAPPDLRLPVALRVDAVRIDLLQVDTLPPITQLQARLTLGAGASAQQRLEQLTLQWEHARIQGSLQVAAAAPMATQATLQAQSTGATPWRASASASGPLARLAVALEARGEAPAGRSPPAAQLHATVAPFARWPLLALALQTRALDLSALSPRLPETALSGQAELQSSGLDLPASARIALDNASPGRWDDARLPLQRLQLVLSGTPRHPQQLALQGFEAQLADAQGRAGTVRGQGQWQADTLALALQLEDVQPARLDGRAAPMRLTGPLTLKAAHLPLPAAAAPAPTAASAPAAAPQVGIEARLSGRTLDGSGLPAQLVLSAEGTEGLWRLHQVEASAGAARLQARGQARREADGWQLTAEAQVRQFDPLPWWRGAKGSAWRQGPHRFSGQLQAQLRWLGLPGRGDPLDRWRQAWTGTLQAALEDSRLAGVPLAGQLKLDAAAGSLGLEAALTMGGNRFGASARVGPDPAADRWQLQARAPALGALAPLLPLAAEALPDAADWLPGAGQLEGEAQLAGRWPALRSSGQWQVRGLRSPRASLAQAALHWHTGDAADAPLALSIQAEGLALGTTGAAGAAPAQPLLDHLEAEVAGSLAAHTLRFAADSTLKPPAWMENLLGPSGNGTRLAGEGRGEWRRLGTGTGTGTGTGSVWRLQALTLRGGARDAPAGTPSWLAGQDLGAELQLDARGLPQAMQWAPGRVQLLTTALRWREARWQAEPASPAPAAPAGQLVLDAELESFDVAALLRRLQPAMGWGGDLLVGGRIDIRSARRFDADVVLERLRGDLDITDELGQRQALGLSELRLALGAHDGVWQFAQGLAGAQLGEIAGAQVIHTDAQRRWPAADAPLQGVLEARVANLGVWGTWVPPGWRLAGSLHTSASLDGRFHAPELRGRMDGSGLAVRNLLQGVNVSDGELAVTLAGERARIERLRFRGGDGHLTVSGGALLGEQPSAQLQLVAEHFRVLGRLDRRIVASGSAELRLDARAVKLDGRVAIDEGLIDLSHADAPTLDADVRVHRPGAGASAPAAGAQAPAAAPAPRRQAEVSVAVDLGRQLRLRGRGIDTGLRGELRVTSPGGRLALGGTVRTEGGTYAAYGQKLDITRGELHFTGAADNPRLDVLAIRPDLDVRVGVSIVGTALSPRIRLTSEPEMPEYDKLSWLVLGRSPDGLGRTDTALLQRAAVALLAGDGKAPTDELLNALGLTDFSVRQTEGDVRETIVSLGKQLSRRWYVGYERSVNATNGTWQLIYRVAQRFTLRAQSGNENSVDVIWSWRW